jgi:arylformamidase
MPRTFVELSHEIEAGMVTYPGLPGPVVSAHLTRAASGAHYAAGTSFGIERVELVGNTGTCLDSPFHRFAEGVDLAGLTIDRLADLDGLVVDATRSPGRAVDAGVFEGLDLRNRAVLVHTGWGRHWRTPRYADGHPYLTRRSAELLARGGPALVGIDSLNIDDTEDGTRPAHTLLLGAGIPVVEHLCNLDRLPAAGFRLHCAPVRFRGVGTWPVRAYALVE